MPQTRKRIKQNVYERPKEPMVDPNERALNKQIIEELKSQHSGHLSFGNPNTNVIGNKEDH